MPRVSVPAALCRLQYDVAPFHHFKRGDEEVWHWSKVRHGDLVVSPGSIAYKAKDFASRDNNTKALFLVDGLLLVLSRIEGCPGEVYDDAVTFVVMSRHGPLVLVQQAKVKDDHEDGEPR